MRDEKRCFVSVYKDVVWGDPTTGVPGHSAHSVRAPSPEAARRLVHAMMATPLSGRALHGLRSLLLLDHLLVVISLECRVRQREALRVNRVV